VLLDPFPPRSEFAEHAVLNLGMAFLLAVAAVASFPCWSYSRRWGYVPCATTAIVLFFVALIAVGGKPAASETVSAARVPTAPVTAVLQPHPYIIDSSREPIPLKRSLEPVSTAAAAPANDTASQ
jgi:hypothetical protein